MKPLQRGEGARSLQSLAALFEGSSLSEDWANPGSLVLVMAHVEGFGGFVKVVLT